MNKTQEKKVVYFVVFITLVNSEIRKENKLEFCSFLILNEMKRKTRKDNNQINLFIIN